MKLYKFNLPQLILIVAILINSCVKESSSNSQDNPIPNNGIIVDSSVFFKITFLGKTLRIYPIYKNGKLIDIINTGDKNNCLVATYTNSDNQTESMLKLNFGPNNVKALRDFYDVNISWGTCEIALQTNKLGNNLGSYNLKTFGSIYDYSIGGNSFKEYKIDSPIFGGTNSSDFTIKSIDSKYITGVFTCILIDGTNRIPASGSFRVPS